MTRKEYLEKVVAECTEKMKNAKKKEPYQKAINNAKKEIKKLTPPNSKN